MIKGPFFISLNVVFFSALFFFNFITASVSNAQDCPSKLQSLKSVIYTKYDIEKKRNQLVQLRARLTQQEQQTFLSLSQKFKAIPPDSEQNMNDLFALQNQSRRLVRSVTQKAGYRILNPEEQSPFDALIEQKTSSDGFMETVLEVRSLLIRQDPLPHLTIWSYRQDPAHNPWKMISIGIMPQQISDYASWADANGKRVSGTMKDFLKAQLSEDCQ